MPFASQSRTTAIAFSTPDFPSASDGFGYAPLRWALFQVLAQDSRIGCFTPH